MDDAPATAPRTVDYYFSMVSPWAYIGGATFADLRRRRGFEVRYLPMSLPTVFPESGGLPLKQRHPARQRYRMAELQRWRDRRGLRFDLEPPFWPFDAALADRTMLVLARRGVNLDDLLQASFAALWEKGRDLADPAELARLLRDAGQDDRAVLEEARGDAAAEAYAGNARQALAAGVFGSPAYVLDGEVFWGQDRLDLLDDALASERAPYRVT